MNKRLKGMVISDKMDKTVMVKVVSWKTHPLYQKKYKQDKKYKVHDPENQLKVGDEILIEEYRPISKDKRWKRAREKE